MTRQNQTSEKTFRLGPNEMQFLQLICAERELNINSTKEEFVENLVKSQILRRIESAYSKGSYYA